MIELTTIEGPIVAETCKVNFKIELVLKNLVSSLQHILEFAAKCEPVALVFVSYLKCATSLVAAGTVSLVPLGPEPSNFEEVASHNLKKDE